MGFGLRASAPFALWAAGSLAGCALIAGLGDGDGTTSAAAEAGADRTSGGDGAAAGDAATCQPKELEDIGPFPIPRVDPTVGVTVDGDSREWQCVDSMALVRGDRRVDVVAGQAVAKIAVQYDRDAIYALAIVTTKTPGGGAGSTVNYKNDSFHFYIMGPTVTDDYTAEDHHIVVDLNDVTTDYSDVAGVRGGLAGISAKSSAPREGPTPDTQIFEVEIKVSANAIGRTSLEPGAAIRMNFQVNDGPPIGGALGPPYRVWFIDAASCPPTTACSINGNSEPYCNPKCTVPLTLQ